MRVRELERVSELFSTWRDRLCDLSRFMRCINEPIAPMAKTAGTSLSPFAEQEAGGMPFNLKGYLELVDRGGREIKRNKRGYIPTSVPPIATRLEMDASPVLVLRSRSWRTNA